VHRIMTTKHSTTFYLRALAASIARLPDYDAELLTFRTGLEYIGHRLYICMVKLPRLLARNTEGEFPNMGQRFTLFAARRRNAVVVVGYSGEDPVAPILVDEIADRRSLLGPYHRAET